MGTDSRIDVALMLGGTAEQRGAIRFRYCVSAVKRFFIANCIWAAASITPPYDLLDEITRTILPYYVWAMNCAAVIAFVFAVLKLRQLEKLNNTSLVGSTLGS